MQHARNRSPDEISLLFLSFAPNLQKDIFKWFGGGFIHKWIKVAAKGIQTEKERLAGHSRRLFFFFLFYTKEKQKCLTFRLLHSLLFKVVRKRRYKGETVTSLPPSFSVMFASSPCHTNTERFRALLSLNTKDRSLRSVPLTNFKVMQTPKR